MNCPEHLVYGKHGLWVWLYWYDVPRNLVPLKAWANPLRYQVSYVLNGKRLFCINREGRWWGRFYWFLIRKR
jgi:hypothetical protein